MNQDQSVARLVAIHPKLPMRDKALTRNFYTSVLGFTDIGVADYPDYLLLRRDDVEIHFFLHRDLNPLENDGQVYIRTNDIHALADAWRPWIHPSGGPELKPWGQWEFAILDPDHNLLTFGQSVDL